MTAGSNIPPLVGSLSMQIAAAAAAVPHQPSFAPVRAAQPSSVRVRHLVEAHFELEEMPTPEIGRILELPSGTVASRLRRAREQFQTHVKRLRAATSRNRRGDT